MKAEQWDRLLQGRDCGCVSCDLVTNALLLGADVDFEQAEKMHSFVTEQIVISYKKPLTGIYDYE